MSRFWRGLQCQKSHPPGDDVVAPEVKASKVEYDMIDFQMELADYQVVSSTITAAGMGLVLASVGVLIAMVQLGQITVEKINQLDLLVIILAELIFSGLAIIVGGAFVVPWLRKRLKKKAKAKGLF